MRRRWAVSCGKRGPISTPRSWRVAAAAYALAAPAWLRQVPAVETLRRVWVQNFYIDGERLQWRTETQGIPPAADFISSPYDPDAHYAKKNTTQWVGYKIHMTE